MNYARHPDCISDPPSLFDTDRGCEQLTEALERLGYPDHLAQVLVETSRYGWSEHACGELIHYLRRHVQPVIDREDSE